jgi:circadian clock protein KaiA
VTTAPQVLISSLVTSHDLAKVLSQTFVAERYQLAAFQQGSDLLAFLQQKNETHCLILESTPQLTELLPRLYKAMVLLPAVIILPDAPEHALPARENSQQAFYHIAEVQISLAKIDQVGRSVETAIQQFLQVTTKSPLRLVDQAAQLHPEMADTLLVKQQELSLKLKERLGYFGVFYKRDPQLFFRHMSPADQQALLKEIKAEYREIVLGYFNATTENNQKIDAMVTKAFFGDLSVSQILEIHMELMDIFAKQLKLEGRSEDVLLDYRLTLIDVISHLCEMYRRSLPRET